jgi:hypothetical protein
MKLKTQVFVLVPYSFGADAVLEVADRLMGQHRRQAEDARSRGRFDYLVGPDGCFRDHVAEGRFPKKIQRSVVGKICEIERLPSNLVPGALVTPDGNWYDLSDHGWQLLNEGSEANQNARSSWANRYHELIRAHPHCWVLEFCAHS